MFLLNGSPICDLTMSPVTYVFCTFIHNSFLSERVEQSARFVRHAYVDFERHETFFSNDALNYSYTRKKNTC